LTQNNQAWGRLGIRLRTVSCGALLLMTISACGSSPAPRTASPTGDIEPQRVAETFRLPNYLLIRNVVLELPPGLLAEWVIIREDGTDLGANVSVFVSQARAQREAYETLHPPPCAPQTPCLACLGCSVFRVENVLLRLLASDATEQEREELVARLGTLGEVLQER
jgi:hypothetical protein